MCRQLGVMPSTYRRPSSRTQQPSYDRPRPSGMLTTRLVSEEYGEQNQQHTEIVGPTQGPMVQVVPQAEWAWGREGRNKPRPSVGALSSPIDTQFTRSIPSSWPPKQGRHPTLSQHRMPRDQSLRCSHLPWGLRARKDILLVYAICASPHTDGPDTTQILALGNHGSAGIQQPSARHDRREPLSPHRTHT